MDSPLATYRLLVPRTDGDGQPVPASLRGLIEDRLSEVFENFGSAACSPCGACNAYSVDSRDLTQVFDVARGVARLLLRPVAFVALPNGHVAVLPVDLSFSYE